MTKFYLQVRCEKNCEPIPQPLAIEVDRYNIWYDLLWYMIYDIWYMIYDIWYMIYDIANIHIHYHSGPYKFCIHAWPKPMVANSTTSASCQVAFSVGFRHGALLALLHLPGSSWTPTALFVLLKRTPIWGCYPNKKHGESPWIAMNRHVPISSLLKWIPKWPKWFLLPPFSDPSLQRSPVPKPPHVATAATQLRRDLGLPSMQPRKWSKNHCNAWHWRQPIMSFW